MKLLEAGNPPTERITVMETWIRYQGRVYKLWNQVIVGDWPEDEAPYRFDWLTQTCANTYDL